MEARKKADEKWTLTYEGFDPETEKLRETLCTVGNGYFGTRGCAESERASENHYPGTYIAGLYNRLPSVVHGKEIFNDDFVNCPNWLLMEFKIGSGPYVGLLANEIVSFRQELDFKSAVLSREIVVRDKEKRTTRVATRRFASMDNPHIAALEYRITPLDYSDTIEVRSSLDGTVVNDGVPRYRGLSCTHLTPVSQGAIDTGIHILVETNQSHVQIAMCARHSVHNGVEEIQAKRSIQESDAVVSEQLTFDGHNGKTIIVEKIVSIATSRDKNTASAIDASRALLSWTQPFVQLMSHHSKAWKDLWYTADIAIDGDPFAQKVIRLHIYHLLTTASQHNIDIDAGTPARGLHGEAYRGHIFWDSIFVLPFYLKRFPKVARSALMYRYSRLNAARNYARENGYEGAMFPWQSAHDGQEETQVIHYNPVSGKWDPDFSCRQRHVSIAIFYNIYEYFDHTGDNEFMNEFGLEMIIEIARFWASSATCDDKDKRYHIHGVMGPDEFHEKYMGSDKPGISDNAYTNVMVVWVLERALEMVKRIPGEKFTRLVQRINFRQSEVEDWKTIAQNMYVPMADGSIISQFEGYMDLEEIDWEHYRQKYGDIHRMDRILKSEGDSPDRYKVAKQADVLMLFYVLPPDEVIAILKRLGYVVKNQKKFLERNYNYYEHRTSHGSTLSKVVHAAISREMGSKEGMWHWFMEALKSDISDTQGGTTAEGIHSGVMAGSIAIIIRVLGGVQYSNNQISISPSLPSHWTRLKFKLVLRGIRYRFELTQKSVQITVDSKGPNPLVVNINKEDSPPHHAKALKI